MIAPGLDVNLDHEPNRESQGCDVVTQSDSVGLGERVKTNRRDGLNLAKLLRACELTAVWVPDDRHEAMRDLSRARLAAHKDLRGKRQQIISMMLRLGRIYPRQEDMGAGPHGLVDATE